MDPAWIILLPLGPLLWEKSTMLPASVSKRAEPPSLRLKKCVSLKPLLVIVAVPALLCAVKDNTPPVSLVMVALPAVLLLKNVVRPPKVLLIVALAADDVWRNSSAPPKILSIVMVAALVALRKVVVPPNPLVIDVMPEVSALTMSKKPLLTTAPTMLACVASVPSCSVAQEQMKVPPV